ncbi:unnamed protein product [Arctogadus glacialis]
MDFYKNSKHADTNETLMFHMVTSFPRAVRPESKASAAAAAAGGTAGPALPSCVQIHRPPLACTGAAVLRTSCGGPQSTRSTGESAELARAAPYGCFSNVQDRNGITLSPD